MDLSRKAIVGWGCLAGVRGSGKWRDRLYTRTFIRSSTSCATVRNIKRPLNCDHSHYNLTLSVDTLCRDNLAAIESNIRI